MKVSEMIKNLVEFITNYGDLECYYAVDDEGNDCHPVYFEPNCLYKTMEGTFENIEYIETHGYEDDECEPVCIVN
jgi:hypothetical protein